MCLCSKQSSLFSFYALPSGGKSKDKVVHWIIFEQTIKFVIESKLVKLENSSSCAVILSPTTFSVLCIDVWFGPRHVTSLPCLTFILYDTTTRSTSHFSLFHWARSLLSLFRICQSLHSLLVQTDTHYFPFICKRIFFFLQKYLAKDLSSSVVDVIKLFFGGNLDFSLN